MKYRMSFPSNSLLSYLTRILVLVRRNDWHYWLVYQRTTRPFCNQIKVRMEWGSFYLQTSTNNIVVDFNNKLNNSLEVFDYQHAKPKIKRISVSQSWRFSGKQESTSRFLLTTPTMVCDQMKPLNYRKLCKQLAILSLKCF